MQFLIVLITIMWSMTAWANDLYVTQSGASLVLDVLQDGQNNTIGNSTTASTISGASSNLNIDQVGDSRLKSGVFRVEESDFESPEARKGANSGSS